MSLQPSSWPRISPAELKIAFLQRFGLTLQPRTSTLGIEG